MSGNKQPATGRYLWVFPVSDTRWLWVPLARKLGKRLGLRPVMLVRTEQDAGFYRRQAAQGEDGLECVVTVDQYEIARLTDPADAMDLAMQAADFERRFGISLMRDMVQADRHLGRGFMWGWNGNPASFAADGATLPRIHAACIEQVRFFDGLTESHPPGLVVANGGGTGIASKLVPLLCGKRGVPFRNLASARLGALYYWAFDEFENSPMFEAAIREAPAPNAGGLSAAAGDLEPPAAFSAVMAQGRNESLARTLQTAALLLARRLHMRWKGYSKARYGYRPFSIALAPLYRWAHERSLNRAPQLTIDQLPADRKLVVIPLQFEPEASLNGQSPESSLSLTVIYETALSLPADALLVIKEHPLQIGRRPMWFYKRVRALPNAVLLQPRQPSARLLPHTAMVVQINSSMGYEAAMRGIPVASFSRHGPIRALAHVKVIRGTNDLDWLRDTLAASEDPAMRAGWREAGARYVDATRRFCMELPDLRVKGRVGGPTEEELDTLVRHLKFTLEGGCRAANSIEPATGSI